MTNASNIMENNYNLTKLFGTEAIDNPTYWLGNLNEQLHGYYSVSILAVIGITLFFLMRQNQGVSDSEAIVYSGLVCTVIGLFLFLADIMTGNTIKLISWTQLLPFIVITAIGIFIDWINR